MADKLEAVYHIFDPEPLRAEQENLYVDLDDVRGDADTVKRLATKIRLSKHPTCQLLAGHRGSGKSTELQRLKRALETGDKKFFVVYCQSDDDIDRNDVDFPDVLIAVVRQMAQQLQERAGITLRPGYFTDRWERCKEFFDSDVELEKLTLGAGMLQLSTRIKSGPATRKKIREALEPDAGNWLNAANDVIGKAILEVKKPKHGYSGLVIIVDDLDKMVHRPHADAGCSTSEYLFVNREAQLSGFKCHTVYTIPLALAYSTSVQAIATLYGGQPPIVPMVKIAERPPSTTGYQPGIKKFRTLIEQRIQACGVSGSDVFVSDDVRDELIRLSGGQPRELMILVRESVIANGLPIDTQAVARAAREGRRAYARQLRTKHWRIIEQVRRGEAADDSDDDRAFQTLLESRALLQYVNDDQWYGVNPLVGKPRQPPAGP